MILQIQILSVAVQRPEEGVIGKGVVRLQGRIGAPHGVQKITAGVVSTLARPVVIGAVENVLVTMLLQRMVNGQSHHRCLHPRLGAVSVDGGVDAFNHRHAVRRAQLGELFGGQTVAVGGRHHHIVDRRHAVQLQSGLDHHAAVAIHQICVVVVQLIAGVTLDVVAVDDLGIGAGLLFRILGGHRILRASLLLGGSLRFGGLIRGRLLVPHEIGIRADGIHLALVALEFHVPDAVQPLEVPAHVQKRLAEGEGIGVPQADLRGVLPRQEGLYRKSREFGQLPSLGFRDGGAQRQDEAQHAAADQHNGKQQDANPLKQLFQLHDYAPFSELEVQEGVVAIPHQAQE